MEANKAYFMVRAQVPSESERAKFDQWYGTDRKSTRLNSSHTVISYAVFCLKKKHILKISRYRVIQRFTADIYSALAQRLGCVANCRKLYDDRRASSSSAPDSAHT